MDSELHPEGEIKITSGNIAFRVIDAIDELSLSNFQNDDLTYDKDKTYKVGNILILIL